MSGVEAFPPAQVADEQTGRIPGEAGLWVFIFGDMLIFLAFFASYLVERAEDPALFNASSQSVGLTIGLVNTIILLTSSLMVAAGVSAYRGGARRIARWMFVMALLCAIAFTILKVSEYAHLIGTGHGPGSNSYFTWFFVVTGTHLMHVLIGFLTLGMMISRAGRDEPVEKGQALIEGAGCYWHMVDLLWMVIFPLLYLLS
ncbi:MAG: cytochrome c oxidase subunit 3 [Paracoccus sp. (in: a-proteobacteria)]|uniref:cytochrome c oxidase subunit 3 n=1 Tax=Paracoccus sp. TaxID=267 RepID=UPI0039E7008A